MSSPTPDNALALPVIQPSSSWPTFSVSTEERARRARTVPLSGPSGAVAGTSAYGIAAKPSRSWGPQYGGAAQLSPSISASPPAPAVVVSASKSPAPSPAGGHAVPAAIVASPASPSGLGTKRRWTPGGSKLPAMPPPPALAPRPLATVTPARSMSPAPRWPAPPVRSPIRGATVALERQAAWALTVSLLAIVLPFVVATMLAVAYAGNVAGLVMAGIAVGMARGPLGDKGLSPASRRRAKWAIGISVVIALACLILFTLGV